MPRHHWEDFVSGSIDQYGPRPVTREEIIAFAAEFDPQPMHLDEEAGRGTLLGGIAASGWHSCAIVMRMLCDWFLLDAASWGSPGVEEVRWLKPVRPGDSLTLRRTVVETRQSRSRPEAGFVKFRFELLNQTGEVVMTLVTSLMIGVRGASPVQAKQVRAS